MHKQIHMYANLADVILASMLDIHEIYELGESHYPTSNEIIYAFPSLYKYTVE